MHGYLCHVGNCTRSLTKGRKDLCTVRMFFFAEKMSGGQNTAIGGGTGTPGGQGGEGGRKGNAKQMDLTLEDEDDFYLKPAQRFASPDKKAAKANHDPMVCLIDMTSSEIEKDSGKIPFLVSMPVMDRVAAENTSMCQPDLGMFIVPREVTVLGHNVDLPLFSRGNQVPELEGVFTRMKQSIRYQYLMKAIDLVDDAIIFNQQGGYDSIQTQFTFSKETISQCKFL